MARQGGLGRGLGALLPAATSGQSGLLNVRLSAILTNPRQPREAFDDAGLVDLAQSIREVGVLQPVLVRPSREGGRYELVAGERRVRAAKMAGLDEIPAVIRHTADEQLLTEALVENLHRADLNPLEEAGAYQQLLGDFGFTHEQLASRLGRSRSTLTNALRLLALPPGLQQWVAEGTLSAGHARALLTLDTAEQQRRTAQRVVAEGLSVRATEELVRRLVSSTGNASVMGELATKARGRRSSPYEALQGRLGDALGTRVQIKGSTSRGRLVIDYAGRADLERLLTVLSRGTGSNLVAEE